MSLVKNLAGQTIVYGLGHILPRILHFIVFNSYLTYKWNDEKIEYAIYLELYAYASLLIVIFSYRMDTALFRFGKKAEDLDRVYSTALFPIIISSLAMVLLGFFFANPLSDLLGHPGKGYYIIWFSLIIALDVIALLPYAKYRLENKALTFIKFKISNVLITVILVLLFLEIMPTYLPSILDRLTFIQSDVDYVFLANLIASLIICVVILAANIPQVVKVDWVLWRKMVFYALPLIIVGVAGSINQFFAVPLQKFFLGAEIEINSERAAVYGAVQKIAALLAMFTTAYNYAAEPFFFRHSERKDAQDLYGEIALFFIISAGFISIFLFGFLELFQFVIGSNFREGLYLIPVLLMAYIFLGIYYNVSIWYKLSDNTGYGAVIATVGSIITLSGSVLLLPIIGIDASAWVALLCYLVMVGLAYYIGKVKYPIHYPVKRMFYHILLIVIILLLIHLTRSDVLILNIFYSFIVLGVYSGVVFFLEKSRLQILLKRK